MSRRHNPLKTPLAARPAPRPASRTGRQSPHCTPLQHVHGFCGRNVDPVMPQRAEQGRRGNAGGGIFRVAGGLGKLPRLSMPSACPRHARADRCRSAAGRCTGRRNRSWVFLGPGEESAASRYATDSVRHRNTGPAPNRPKRRRIRPRPDRAMRICNIPRLRHALTETCQSPKEGDVTRGTLPVQVTEK